MYVISFCSTQLHNIIIILQDLDACCSNMYNMIVMIALDHERDTF